VGPATTPPDLEAETWRIGRELHAALPSPARHPLRALDDRALEHTSADAELRAALFRFVDVVPACRSLDDLARHLNAYLGELERAPAPLGVALRMGDTRAGRAALGAAAAAGVRHIAHRFIVGEDPVKALGVLRGLWDDGVATTVDLLGEATVTAAEADRYAQRCTDALDALAADTRRWPQRPRLEADSVGALPRVNLSVKVSALTPLLRAHAPARGQADAAPRLDALLRRASSCGAHLHIDTESLDTRDAVLELVLDRLAAQGASRPSAGIVVQAYLRDSQALLGRVLDWAQHAPGDPPITIRLVKGAYWDHEVIEARQHGWDTPVYLDKADSDRNFETLTRHLLDARSRIRVAIASHNLRSVAHAIAYSRLAGAPDGELELQVLRGLGDPLQAALCSCGLRVRSYCPVGNLVAGMAYLVRRLLENTANESFIAEQQAGADVDRLLAAP